MASFRVVKILWERGGVMMGHESSAATFPAVQAVFLAAIMAGNEQYCSLSKEALLQRCSLPLSPTIQISKAGGLLSEEDVLLRNLGNTQEKRGGFSKLYTVQFLKAVQKMLWNSWNCMYIYLQCILIILLLSDVSWTKIIRCVLYI